MRVLAFSLNGYIKEGEAWNPDLIRVKKETKFECKRFYYYFFKKLRILAIDPLNALL